MSTTPLYGRRILVTGASDGIGLHTATGLAARGAHVVLVGRDEHRGRAAAAAVTGRAGAGGGAEFVAADLASQSGVRDLARRVGDRPLDVLVNNVGGLYTQRWETVDGIEASLAVNALNPFLLTSLLLPVLGPTARVVYVTGGRPGRIDPDDLQNSRRYLGLRAYSHAKSVLMALALEQAGRLRGVGTTVNVAYPGAADTPMTRAMTGATLPPAMRLVMPVFRPVMSRARPERAARSSIHLAADPALAGVTGTYLGSRSRPARWPADVLDAGLRRRLWTVAEQLTGLAQHPAGP